MTIPPFKLERFFAKYEFQSPYLMCSSDCESLSVGDLLGLEPGAEQAFHDHWLGYTESYGSPGLRQEIARHYTTITSDDVLVHAGAEEAIFAFMNAVFSPGDHLIVHYPCYQSLTDVAQAAGCEVTKWQTRPDDGWELDVDFLERSIRPTTHAIVFNCPHNPTGYLMSSDKLARIIDIARRQGILVFSDEVYRYLEYGGERLPAACDLYENAVSLGVMSKTYGLAGLRIGWIATRNRTVFDRMAAYKDYLSICNSAPSEFLATLALRHRETIAQRNRDIILHNLGVLDQFFGKHTALFTWTRPKGGSTAFPGLVADRSAEAFCTDLIEKQGVLLLPSTCFDYDDRHFRVGFGRKNLPEAVAKLDEYVSADR